MRTAFGFVRLIASAGAAFALVANLVYTLGFSGPVFANFISYFTVQCSTAAIVLWAVAGVDAIRHTADPHWLTLGRLLVTTYLIVSGIVFTVIHIQAAARDVPLGMPWSTLVLHYVLPSYALLDWLLAPGRGALRWRALPTVLAFPVVWGIYTLARGAFVGWYPYYFLDAAQVSPIETTGYCTIAAGLFLGISATLLATVRVFSHLAERLRLDSS